jgi:GNAT superfamily N-acetyltransferase
LIDVDAASFDSLPCCGIKSPTHPGRQQKRCWLQANAKFGLRAKMLLAPDGKPSGYIEYLPGEFAWRGVEAGGSMFIHCVWIFSKQHQRKGWGRIMVEGCLEDARKAGLSGAAVMVRDGPILPTAACSWRTVSNGCAAGLPIACSEVR